MSVIRISRSGKAYRLHVSRGPNGKDKFFFSTKPACLKKLWVKLGSGNFPSA